MDSGARASRHTQSLPAPIPSFLDATLTNFFARRNVALLMVVASAVNGTLSYLASDLLGSATVALDGSDTPTASQLYVLYGGTRYQNRSCQPTMASPDIQYCAVHSGMFGALTTRLMVSYSNSAARHFSCVPAWRTVPHLLVEP